MPSYTIYAETSDQTAFGTGTSRTNAANAVDGASVLGSTDSDLYVGPERPDPSGYIYYQARLAFNTSAVVGTVQSGSVNWVNANNDGGSITIEATPYDWILDDASTFRTRTQLSALSRIAEGSVLRASGARSIPLTSLSISITSSYKIVLHTQDQRTGSGISNPAEGAHYLIRLHSANATGTTNDPYLSITTVTSVSLTVDNASHAHTATSPTLAAKSTLAVNGATHAHAATSPTVSFIPGVAPDNTVHGHTATSPVLVPHAVLAVNDNHHGHQATSPTLAFGTVLAVNDGLHAHLATSPALTRTTGLITIALGGSGPGKASGLRSYASSSSRDYRSGGGRAHTSMRSR